MTIERDLDRRLASYFEESSVQAPPADLLARSLARVGSTGQRPAWLIGGIRVGGSRTVGGTLIPAWIAVALAILTAIAVIVIGSRLMLTTIVPEPSASPGPSTQTPSPSLTETPDLVSTPLGGRGILAEVFALGATGQRDLVSIDAGTGVGTLLGTVPGPRTPSSRLAGTVSFQRTTDHVLILDGDSGQHVSGMTAAGDALGLIAASEIPLDCCGNGGVEGMRLSPRGDRVAFLAVDRSETPLEIVVVNLADGTSSHVPLPSGPTQLNSQVGVLDWSPDESAVLAYGCRPCNHAATPQERQTSHHSHLYVLPLDGSSPRELGDIDNGSIIGTWAPDGATIDTAIWWCAKGSHMPRCDPAEGENTFGTIDLGGGLPTSVGNDPEDGTGLFELKFSPDGTRVAYRTNDGLFVRGVHGDAPLKLADGQADWADWSPDGQWILFSRNGTELWIVPSSGGDPRRIGNDLAGAAW